MWKLNRRYPLKLLRMREIERVKSTFLWRWRGVLSGEVVVAF